MRVFIDEIARHVDQEVELRGWLYQRRSKGKIHFLILRDGTGFLQATVVQGRDQRAHAVSSRPASRAAMAKAKATTKPT